MMVDKDTITWQEWVSDSSVGESTRTRRKHVLNIWARVNSFESPTGVLDAIKLDQKTPYGTVRLFLDTLRKQGFKGISINLYRSTFPNFFLSVLGESNFSERVFARLVPQDKKAGVSTTKNSPTVEEFKHLLRIAEPRERALLALLATTGMRIGEAVSRKMSEIEDRGDYARIRLPMVATKSGVKRTAFLTHEVVQYIQDYHHAGVKNNWVFPGGEGNGTTERDDHHITTSAAYLKLKKVFEDGGLNDTETEIYSPHSLRTFADSWMRKAGLKEKFVDAIIGHTGKLGSNANYLDWREIEEGWVSALCEKGFLVETQVILKSDPNTEAELTKLRVKVGEMGGFYDALRDFLRKQNIIIELGEKGLPSKIVDRKLLPEHYPPEDDKSKDRTIGA